MYLRIAKSGALSQHHGAPTQAHMLDVWKAQARLLIFDAVQVRFLRAEVGKTTSDQFIVNWSPL